jgi:hypothetical protein
MQMTNRRSERIGRISRLGHVVEAQQILHHLLHLGFGGTAVTHYGHFNFQSRIFHQIDIGMRGR